MKKFIKVFFVLALVAGLSISASAKKMTVMSFNKGELPDDVFGCESTLSEDNVEKKGDFSLKLTFENKGWAGLDKPKKGAWKDYLKCRFIVVNPTDKPLEGFGFMIKGAKMTNTPENRKDWAFTLKPGKNELEVPLVNVLCNDGKSTLDVSRLLRWTFLSTSSEKLEVYVQKVWVEDKDEK
ncbi:MAG: hypothetical protein WCI43_07270 [Candidatus Firestonebacteria bacterium]